MSLFSVRLELARTREFPDGSAAHYYEFVAPLDHSGHLDAAEWQRSKAKCSVRHLQPGHPEANGALVHAARGWHFDYDRKSHDDDQRLVKIDRHLIKEGEYVSIAEHDGVTRPYRVVHVRQLS